MKEKVAEYESLKLQIKILEDKAKVLNQEILEYMVENGATETPELPMGGVIKVAYTIKWKYPTSIVNLEAELKEEQHRSQIDGTAEKVESPYIKYYAGK